MAWAFATVNCRNVKIFAVLARAAERRRLSEFNGQDRANTGWAFAKENYREE